MSSIFLTTEEVRELKRMCSDSFMELGMTLRPKHLDCFKEHVATHSMMVIIEFEEHVDAEKWNKMHETRIRMGGHLATITLTGLVGMLGGGWLEMTATASTVSIVKDEIQARIWYPKMFEGWLLTRHFIFRYKQFPSHEFNISWTDVIQNDKGEEQEKRVYNSIQFKVGGNGGIPVKIVRDLMVQYPVRALKFK